jgi:hypothetical protein
VADAATAPVQPGGGSSLPFYSLAVVNSTDMLCNGRADICDLRYNQVVTYYILPFSLFARRIRERE